MKLVFSLAIFAAAFFQQPAVDLTDVRTALGGDAALGKIERLHIKASFTSPDRGKGETESFAVLPDRFLETSHGVKRQSTAPAGMGPDMRQTVGFANIDVEDHDTNRDIGFIGDELIRSGEVVPKWWTDEWRTKELAAGRFAFGRMVLPLLAGAPTVISTFRKSGAVIFQDKDMTTWTMALDAESRPSTLTFERKISGNDGTLYTSHAQLMMTFSDYRAVTGGVTWPHHIVTTVDGKPYDDVRIKSYEINGKAPKVLLK